MGKAKKKSRKEKETKRRPEALPPASVTTLLERLESPRAIFTYFGVVFILLVLIYKPIVLDGLEVTGSDVVSGIGKTHQLKLYEEKTGKMPLWNPYMFAGMPIYQRLGPVVWSLDTILQKLGGLVDWRVWYLWAGALGMFFLIKYLGLSAVAAMLAALGFILLPHYHALIIVGHYSKIRALIWIPFILVSFLIALQRRNLLGMFLFALAFSLQFRTQHYQIIFYTLLLLLFVGIVPYLKPALEKQWGAFLKLNVLLVGAFLLMLLIIAQPLLVIKEFTPYSARGGNAISLTRTSDEKTSGGVSFEYATNWSYTIDEWWNLIIPKFHGGTSQERYTGKSVPQFRGQIIPAYWGNMPFTQSYEYMGIILVFLALIGIFFRWERVEVKSLLILTLFALLLSLGKHFAPLYKLLFYNLPYFDKFRVPSMILTLVMFNTCVLAAFGLQALASDFFQRREAHQKFWILSAIVGGLLLIPLLFGSSFSLSQPQELQRYVAQFGQDRAPQLLEMLRQARLDILKASTLRTLVFFLLALSAIAAVMRNWIRRDIALIALVVLAGFDLALLTGQYLEGKFADLEAMERQTYRLTAVDPIIQQDKSLFRVSPPLRQIANDTRWSYYYQSLGGYSPAKLQLIQDIFDNNLHQPTVPGLPFNLNVLRMMNVKYLAENQAIRHAEVSLIASDQANNLYLHRVERALPRAFFVKSTEVIPDPVEIVRYLNRPDFDPGQTALLQNQPTEAFSAPDSAWAEVTVFEPERIEVRYFANRSALLVLSEVYYPRGWRAFLENGTPLNIYKTDHILRSMVVPSGTHTVTLTFHPDTFYTGVRISTVGMLITVLGLLFVLVRQYGSDLGAWIVRHRGKS